MSKNLKLSELDKFVMRSPEGFLFGIPVIMALFATIVVQLFFSGVSIVPFLIFLIGEILVVTLWLMTKSKLKKIDQVKFEYIKQLLQLTDAGRPPRSLAEVQEMMIRQHVFDKA